MIDSMRLTGPGCSLADFAVRLDSQGIIRGVDSASFLDDSRTLVGEAFSSLIHPEDVTRIEKAMESALFLEKKQSFVCRLLRKGTPVWVDCHLAQLPDLSPPEFILIAFDVSHWQEDENRISHLATHDPLTDLPNRLLLNDR
ncbi:MAG: PAS domain-containing protein, partial [Burkholderiales bacterium]